MDTQVASDANSNSMGFGPSAFNSVYDLSAINLTVDVVISCFKSFNAVAVTLSIKLSLLNVKLNMFVYS